MLDHLAHEVGGRHSFIGCHSLSPALAGSTYFRQCSQGSALTALHPGLYAATRIRGLKIKPHVSCKSPGNDQGVETPG